MSLYSRVKTWVTGEVLTSTDLNAEFDNILNNSKSSSMVGASGEPATQAGMQTNVDPGEVGTESLPSSIQDELYRLRFSLAEAKGTTQWYQSPQANLGVGGIPSTSFADNTIDGVKLLDNTVAGAKIVDLGLPRTKMAAVGEQLSASCGTFGTSSTSAVDVTNLSVTITTTGRPVVVKLVADGTGSQSYVSFGSVNTGDRKQGAIIFLRGATTVSFNTTGSNGLTGGTNFSQFIHYPAGAFEHIDVVAAGTYTYKAQAIVVGADVSTVNVVNIKLIAYEL